MRLSPRKSEVDAIREVLEDESHASVDAASKAVLNRSADLFGARVFYTVAMLSPHGGPVLLGLFSSEKKAEEALRKMPVAVDNPVIMPVNQIDTIEARLSGQPMPGDCACGHAKHMHRMTGSQYSLCVLSACDCDKFKEGKWEYPKFNGEGESDD